MFYVWQVWSTITFCVVFGRHGGSDGNIRKIKYFKRVVGSSNPVIPSSIVYVEKRCDVGFVEFDEMKLDVGYCKDRGGQKIWVCSNFVDRGTDWVARMPSKGPCWDNSSRACTWHTWDPDSLICRDISAHAPPQWSQLFGKRRSLGDKVACKVLHHYFCPTYHSLGLSKTRKTMHFNWKTGSVIECLIVHYLVCQLIIDVHS